MRAVLHVTCLIVAVCEISAAAKAQDWTLKSSISERGSYNSNLILSPDNKISTFGSITTPQLSLERTSPTSAVTLNGQFPFAEYINHSELSYDSQLLDLNVSKDLSERSTLALQSSFDRDTTLTTDRDVTGEFLTKPVRFISWDVAPSFTYLLSPIETLKWEGSYLSSDYDSSQKTDYQYYGTVLSYERQLSDLTAVTGSLSYFRFVPDDALDTRSDIYGALVGYKYTPSERLLISGSVGLNYDVTHRDDNGGGNNDDSDIGYRVQADLDYALNDQTRARLNLSHDVQPSGNGRLETQNRGAFILDYQFGEMTKFSLNTRYTDSEDYFDTGSSDSDNASRYFSIGPSVTWDITDALMLQASYQLRHKFLDDGGSATDNAAFLTLKYTFSDLHWSGY